MAAAAHRPLHCCHDLWPSRQGRGRHSQGEVDPRAGDRHASGRQRVSRDRSVAAGLGSCRRRSELSRRLAALCGAADEPRGSGSLFRGKRRGCATARRRPGAADTRGCGAADRRVSKELRSDERTQAFRKLVLDAPAPSLAEAPVQALIMNAAVDLMPQFAREMHGLSRPMLPPMVRGATTGSRERSAGPLPARTTARQRELRAAAPRGNRIANGTE